MANRITTFIRKNEFTLVAIAIFVLAAVLRVSIVGLADYPAQARTLDSSYNIAMAEWAENGNIQLMPSYLASGYDDVVQYHPPLLYILPAIFAKLLNIFPWNASWLFFAILSAACTLLLFFIGKKIICEEAGITAGALYIFPIPVLWISPFYNGMWGLLTGQFFLVAELLVLYSYCRNRSLKLALFLGIIIALQFLSHFPETFIFLPFLLLIFIEKFAITKNKKIIRDLTVVLILPILAFIWYAPKLFNVLWRQLDHGFHLNPEITSRLGSSVALAKQNSFGALQLPVIIFFVIGVCFLIMRRKWFWIQSTGYFMLIALLMPYFANDADYFIKFRFFIPLIAYPIAAAGFIFTIEKLTINKKVAAYMLLAAIVIASLLSFGEFKNSGIYQPLTKEKYEALKWIDDNSAQNSKILFLNGFAAFTSSFSHRACFEVDLDSFMERAYSRKADKYNGLWCGFFWSDSYKENYILPYEKSFFEYGYHERLTNISAYNFEYVVYDDDYKDYNDLLKLDNFKEVYYKNKIHVVQNCRMLKC